MIRQPTINPLAWWERALADPMTPRHEGDPQPGFYARRAVRGGPLIPVRVTLHQDVDPATGELRADEVIAAEELGRPINAAAIWTHLRPIPREEYDALVSRHQGDARMAATHVAVSISDTPTRPTKG